MVELYGSIQCVSTDINASVYLPLQLCPPRTQSSGSSALCSYTTSTLDSFSLKWFARTSLFFCTLPSLLFSLQACLSWSNSKLFLCMKVSAAERHRNPFQHIFIVFLLVGSQNVGPSTASGQVKGASCAVCACKDTHSYTQRIQCHASESLHWLPWYRCRVPDSYFRRSGYRPRGPLLASIGRLSSSKTIHTHTQRERDFIILDAFLKPQKTLNIKFDFKFCKIIKFHFMYLFMCWGGNVGPLKDIQAP